MSYRSQRRADRLPRGVLPIVVCLEHDHEASIMRRPWPSRGLLRNGKIKVFMVHHNKKGLCMNISETFYI